MQRPAGRQLELHSLRPLLFITDLFCMHSPKQWSGAHPAGARPVTQETLGVEQMLSMESRLIHAFKLHTNQQKKERRRKMLSEEGDSLS